MKWYKPQPTSHTSDFISVNGYRHFWMVREELNRHMKWTHSIYMLVRATGVYCRFQFCLNITYSVRCSVAAVIATCTGSSSEPQVVPFPWHSLYKKLLTLQSRYSGLATVYYNMYPCITVLSPHATRGEITSHDVYDQYFFPLYLAESYVGKGTYLRRIRYHGRGQFGTMHKYYSHYFLRLREGPPPPKKKRKKEDHKSFLTRKLIQAGPRSIPNSL